MIRRLAAAGLAAAAATWTTFLVLHPAATLLITIGGLLAVAYTFGAQQKRSRRRWR